MPTRTGRCLVDLPVVSAKLVYEEHSAILPAPVAARTPRLLGEHGQVGFLLPQEQLRFRHYLRPDTDLNFLRRVGVHEGIEATADNPAISLWEVALDLATELPLNLCDRVSLTYYKPHLRPVSGPWFLEPLGYILLRLTRTQLRRCRSGTNIEPLDRAILDEHR